MSGELKVTLTGNVTADPELRFTPNGQAVGSFTVAQTPRRYDRDAGKYVDGDTVFMRVSVWRDQAQQVAESIQKGNRVVVTGTLLQRSYEDREGNKRTSIEVRADDVAASMRYATVSIKRAARGSDNVVDPGDDYWTQDEPPAEH
jgi:single-strand DNA-binding protein